MAPIDLSKTAPEIVADAEKATPEERAAALAEEGGADGKNRSTVLRALAPADDTPAPGEVRAPNVPPAQQGATGLLSPVPDSTDRGSAERAKVDLKPFSVAGQQAPTDLFLVLDDVNGEHYFAKSAPAGHGAQLLAVKGMAVDEGIALRVKAALDSGAEVTTR